MGEWSGYPLDCYDYKSTCGAKKALSFNKNALSFNTNLLGKIWHWSDDGNNSANKGSLLFCATKDFFNWCQSINHNEQKPIYKNISNENWSPFNQILSIFWKYLRSSFQSNAYILRPISSEISKNFSQRRTFVRGLASSLRMDVWGFVQFFNLLMVNLSSCFLAVRVCPIFQFIDVQPL